MRSVKGRDTREKEREREREDILIPAYIGLAGDRRSTVERRWSLSNKLDSLGAGNDAIAAASRAGAAG